MEDTIIKALLLGYAHIECNGTPIRICLKKAQGLLFYLLVHKKATRDELTGLLWGGEDNELARRHLRDNLYHLKKVVPIELVVPAGRSAIQLNPELGFYIDVDEFLKAVDVEAYQGEFLKGLAFRTAMNMRNGWSGRVLPCERPICSSLTSGPNSAFLKEKTARPRPSGENICRKNLCAKRFPFL